METGKTARKKKKFIEALRESHGIITYACQKIGISRVTFYDWCKKDEEFKQLAEEVEESTIDRVESKLLQAINDDKLTAIIFYLKTKGKNRGYVERMENNVSVNPFEELMKEIPDDE